MTKTKITKTEWAYIVTLVLLYMANSTLTYYWG